MVAIADVFDALTTVRPYKKAWGVEETLQWIRQQRGSHFDPVLIDRFVGIMPAVLEIKERYAEAAVSWEDKDKE